MGDKLGGHMARFQQRFDKRSEAIEKAVKIASRFEEVGVVRTIAGGKQEYHVEAPIGMVRSWETLIWISTGEVEKDMIASHA